MSATVVDWPTAHGAPLGDAVIRRSPADFVVTEQLVPTGLSGGEHLWLWIEKVSSNTQLVAAQLAEYFGVRKRDVAYAGLKDRHAITRQWFSIWLPGGEKKGVLPPPDHAEFRVLQHVWQTKKIRRGMHSGNHFALVLRDVKVSTQMLEQRLQQISAQGVPNYYGSQRFGITFDARPLAIRWSDDRFQRGMQLSAVRSFLFNLQLAQRVKQQRWQTPALPGWLSWRGSNAGFVADVLDERLQHLLESHELSPSAWLPGVVADPRLAATEDELAALTTHSIWLDQLRERRVLAARRATVLGVNQVEHRIDNDALKLSFTLPPGAFATVVLSELFRVVDAAAYNASGPGLTT